MKGRVALVTGAGRGIGRACAESLAQEGCRVAITARDVDELQSIRTTIAERGQSALVIPADLSEASAPQRIVDCIANEWGPVEILVNNAGVGSSANPKPLADFDDDFWDLTLALNVTAPYRLTKLVLKTMLPARWGRIINISSINAKVPALHGRHRVLQKWMLEPCRAAGPAK